MLQPTPAAAAPPGGNSRGASPAAPYPSPSLPASPARSEASRRPRPRWKSGLRAAERCRRSGGRARGGGRREGAGLPSRPASPRSGGTGPALPSGQNPQPRRRPRPPHRCGPVPAATGAGRGTDGGWEAAARRGQGSGAGPSLRRGPLPARPSRGTGPAHTGSPATAPALPAGAQRSPPNASPAPSRPVPSRLPRLGPVASGEPAAGHVAARWERKRRSSGGAPTSHGALRGQ